MILNNNLKMMITAGMIVSGLATATEQPTISFTPAQKARIGEVAKEYLLMHPEVLIEVSRRLQIQQQEKQQQAMAALVLEYHDALLNDKATPTYGPKDAKVAVIEFFDYQCSVCARQAPVLKALMKANPQVRYVFKEWPIFAQRWEPSLMAAKTGLQIWLEKGADAYLTYHNALYATGHYEGRLTPSDISRAEMQAGSLKSKNDSMLEVLARTDSLAQSLGLRDTPAMIVMPTKNAVADNVTVLPGGADQASLQEAINKAAGNVKK